MTLEIFHSDVQNRYNEENQITSHLENKAGQMLFITSLVSLLLPVLNIDWFVVIPTIFIAIIFYIMMRTKEFSVSIKPEQFFTINNEICESKLEKSIKEAKEQSDIFIRARIVSYFKCTRENKIINAKKGKFLKYIQHLFIIQISILLILLLMTQYLYS